MVPPFCNPLIEAGKIVDLLLGRVLIPQIFLGEGHQVNWEQDRNLEEL